MSANSFGRLFCYTTFGESHGPAIGAIVDGCPAGMPLSEADIQIDLDRRRPGTSKYTTQRKEPDTVQILSGVFEGVTTGTPIGLMIVNNDQRSKDYSKIKNTFRPGHADYTYFRKYGVRDYRGGGRSSARETAMRVAAGAIAKKLLLHVGVKIVGALVAIGEEEIDRNNWNWSEVAKNPFFSPDVNAVPRFEKLMEEIRHNGDSVGALLEVVAQGVPPGWGEPVIDRLDADLAKAMMSINAVKGVEIGAGMAAARGTGSQMADEMVPDKNAPNGVKFLSNYSGGILGGISSGADIVVRVAVKPTSSIHIPKQTIDTNGKAQEIVTHGRHDPCVGIRAVPVAEAMAAIVLADHFLQNRSRANIF
ncbi:MAG: chorismate synthase [Magnetococcales bacterium]|nr:chorismate synthase [Magnetococcales bacterium]